MCVPNSDMQPPAIPMDVCMLCKKRKAQPETGMCRRCDRGFNPFAVALAVAVLGLITGCYTRIVYREPSVTSYSLVTYREPRLSYFGPTVSWRRREEHFEKVADAEQFVNSFTESERVILDVHKTDFVVTQKENSK